MFRKGLVFGIIVLFLSASVVPMVSSLRDTVPVGKLDAKQGVIDFGGVQISLDPPNPNGNHNWYNTSVKVTATISEGWVFYWRYSPSEPWTLYTEPFYLTENHPGFESYEVDNLGNPSAPRWFSLKIDQTAPFTLVYHQKRFNKITFTADPSDQRSGVDYVDFYLNDEFKIRDTEAPYQWTLSPIPNQSLCLKATAYDNAGNSASEYSYVPNSKGLIQSFNILEKLVHFNLLQKLIQK